MRKLAILVLVAVAGLATAAVALGGGNGSTAEPAAKQTRKNIVKTAAADGRFDTLVSLVKSAGLAKTLSGKGPFTVFAPTDKAFKKVPTETLEALGEDPKALKRVLLYHAVAGRYPAARVVKVDSLKTLAGPPRPRPHPRKHRAGGRREGDPGRRQASNGVIHAINAVLLPPR